MISDPHVEISDKYEERKLLFLKDIVVPVSIVPQNGGEGSGQQQTAQNPSWSGRKKEEVTDVLLSCWTRPQGEIRKEDLFKFYKLPWSRHPKRLLSISQGRPVMMRRLQELDLSVSPS